MTGTDPDGGHTEVVSTGGDRTDAVLLARARKGDSAAFWELMRRNNRRLFRMARSILRDENEAEEAVQETYVRALSSIEAFRGEASISTWLARIAMNEALDRLRRQRPTVSLDEVDEESAAIQITPALLPEAVAARSEIRVLLEAGIDRLPPALRTVFVLRAIEQMTANEVSAVLGIAPETVKTRYFRARRLLRQALERDLGVMLDDVFPFAGPRCGALRRRVLDRVGLSLPAGQERVHRHPGGSPPREGATRSPKKRLSQKSASKGE